MPTFNEDAADAVTSHRLALLRYEGGTVRDLLSAYDAALADVERDRVRLQSMVRAGTPIDPERIKRLVALGNDLAIRVRALRDDLTVTLGERLQEAGDAEAAFQSRLFAPIVKLDPVFAGVPADAVSLALAQPLGGKMWADRLATDLFQLQDSIRAVIARDMATGASMPRIAKGLRELGTIDEYYRGRLTAIARTEVQRVANGVALATYEANADVVAGVQYLATLDSRTCAICAPYHNQVFPLTAPRPSVPQHPRCRCFYAPVTKSWQELGFDAPPGRFDGEPARETTFDQWLRRQPAAVVDDILGPTRADLFRRGVPLDRFSDAGRLLNLGELRASLD